MTDWWSNDPVASRPQPVTSTVGDWWGQDATVSGAPAVAAVPAEPEDPIKAQVRKELAAEAAAGRGQGMGAARTFLQGATLGTADEILAGAMTIPNMIKRGTLNPVTAYHYAKEKENQILEGDRSSSGLAGSAAELLGGASAGKALYEAGATLAPAVASRLGTGLLGTAAGAAADGAAYGAITGATEGEGTGRLSGAAFGGTIGAGIGAGVPTLASGLGAIAAPVISNISARVNPAGYAERQVGRAVAESGRSADDVANRVAQAAAEGQGEFRLIDAIGNPGRRMGAVVAKNPGEGRQALTEFLDARQAGQGGRVANAIEEGLGAPETAQAAALRMTVDRGTAANAAYGQARADASAVDTSAALARIDATLNPAARGITSVGDEAGHIAPDSVESILGRARSLLADNDARKVGFEGVQRVKGDLQDATDRAMRAGEGNKARLLGQVTRELDTALEGASPSYAAARNAYRDASRNIDAVETGTVAAGRGRTEDKLRAFNGLSAGEQAGFRTGYADPLIVRAQRSAMNADASRPLTSLAARAELPAFAVPGQGDQMMRRLGREGEMFLTRAKATGGSQTAENLADSAAAGIDPGIIGKLLTGDFFGAGRNALQRGSAALTGNTEAVRAELARRLLSGDASEIRQLLTALAARQATTSNRGAVALRGAIGGSTPLLSRPRTTDQRLAR